MVCGFMPCCKGGDCVHRLTDSRRRDAMGALKRCLLV
jgi:hypothetical protein